ncbi:hypothetical protein pSalSNUABM01_067 [Salmonella phage pSal-SNUABM-01]|nr:hypothetical protein pSalSNUABM01_067 [Salmonella phage pSal-SNUABM-01]
MARLTRDFKVKFFQREDGHEWFKVVMTVTDNTLNDFSGEVNVREYEILDASSYEEFGRLIERLKEAHSSPELFK